MQPPKPPQASLYGTYLYDRIVPADHLLPQIDRPRCITDLSTKYTLPKISLA